MRTTRASGRQPVDARCYECWLPRVSFQVSGSPPYGIGPILQLPQRSVAAEAQYATDPTRLVAVIHVCSGSRKTDAADASLTCDQGITLRLGDAVLTLQVACTPLHCFAERRQAVGSRAVSRPLTVGFDLAACPAQLVPLRYLNPGADVAPFGQLPLLVIGRRALPAVSLQPITHRLVPRKRCPRFVLLAPRATLDGLFMQQRPIPLTAFDSEATGRLFEQMSERNPLRFPRVRRRFRPVRSPRRRSVFPGVP
ncbi:hypothetical protein SUDANB140_01385 [Streptomyces sp. enrichment culture]